MTWPKDKAGYAGNMGGLAGPAGPAGADGAGAFVYIAYASDDSGAGFTLIFNAALDYIAIKETATEIPSPVASDFAGLWKNYKGATGATGSPGATGPAGADGADGADGAGVPPGGTTGQVLAKKSNTDNDTEWVDQTGGGGGADFLVVQVFS